MFVFSLKGPIHPARTTVTENGSVGPAIQVVSELIQSYFSPFLLWLIY